MLVNRGMHGATGNIYCGLHEFEDMAFVLHFLRAGDYFADIGANVGSYTILASGVCGAHTIAVEPVSTTAASLLANVELNSLKTLVRLETQALGEAVGEMQVSTAEDCTNHVLMSNEMINFESVRMSTMDELVGDTLPILIKLDVEGYELQVIMGGKRVLSSQKLAAIIVEVNGSGQKYGTADDVLIESLTSQGFKPHRYDPINRVLSQIEPTTHCDGNMLFIRDVYLVQQRIKSTPRFCVMGESF